MADYLMRGPMLVYVDSDEDRQRWSNVFPGTQNIDMIATNPEQLRTLEQFMWGDMYAAWFVGPKYIRGFDF